MSYHFSKTISSSFEQAITKVTEALKAQGFGIITEIDITGTFKSKLNIDFKKYRVLGACNPQFAYQALQLEDKIGVLLPCNVVIQEKESNAVEISAVNPLETMKAVQNPALADLAQQVQTRLKAVIEQL